jgi:hypothetical protein
MEHAIHDDAEYVPFRDVARTFDDVLKPIRISYARRRGSHQTSLGVGEQRIRMAHALTAGLETRIAGMWRQSPKAAGSASTISWLSPSTRSVRPTTDGSRPNLDCRRR